MYGWTKWQKNNYNTSTEFEYVTPTTELIDACDALYGWVVRKKFPFFDEFPVIHEDYAREIVEKPQHMCDLPYETVKQWLDNPKYLRAIRMPVRVLKRDKLPENLTANIQKALEKQENVYKNTPADIRIHKQEPGDMLILHYDPKLSHGLPNDGKYIDKRAFMYMHDRLPGQVSYMGDKEIDYKKHDMIKFDVEKLYHGAANFGYHDRYMISISWAEAV